MSSVSATQILGARVVWSFALLVVIVVMRREWPDFQQAAHNRKTLAAYTISGTLLAINWLIYIWSVNAGFILESSLGYFINPLVNILLGVVFLRERLRLWQWVPIGLAAAGVAYMTVSYGQLPWIALSLAFTFGAYGLVKKISSLNSLHGLTLETGILFVPALVYMIALEALGRGAMGHSTALVNLLLLGSGIMTTLPLLAFGTAVRRIPLSLLGLLQYIAPTSQFLIGVLMYGESFDHTRLIGFGLIWIALLALGVEGMIQKNHKLSGVTAPAARNA
jgi:chloramphenicol-sensitive protein RarD